MTCESEVRLRFTSHLSTRTDTGAALDEVLDGVPGDPDLLVLFATQEHLRRAQELYYGARAAFPRAVLLGCSAAGVIGSGEEIEGGAGLSLTAAQLPGVSIEAFDVPPPGGVLIDPSVLEEPAAGILLLSDPHSLDVRPTLRVLQEALPGVPVVGGQASGNTSRDPHLMFSCDGVRAGGAIGVVLRGDIELDPVVAQGCRPIGPPMFVTACAGNRILELDGNDPVSVLRGLHGTLPVEDQTLLRAAPFLGVQMRDQDEYHPGDFLIRDLVGVSGDRRGVAVSYLPERFQVVQWHVRDAEAAASDVRAVLGRAMEGRLPPAGGLLFTCVGRGSALFGAGGHDSAQFRDIAGDVPLGGFFGNGEIGPVQRSAYVHGYTSVFALFRPAGG